MTEKIGSFTNSQLSVIAVYLLGGESNMTDMEDVAMKLFEMTPSRFSLHKYPEHIDIHTVRVSLSYAERLPPHHLTGSIKHGYMLMPSGLQWIQNIDINFGKLSEQDKSRKGSISSLFEIERERLRKTNAYQLILTKKTENLSKNDLYDFLRINEYFPKKKALEKISFIQNVVQEDQELNNSWIILKDIFPGEMKKYE